MHQKPKLSVSFFLTLLLSLLLQVQIMAAPGNFGATSAGTSSPSITIENYTELLNEVAASDPHHLYDAKMSDGSAIACFIARSGGPGNYHYSVNDQEKEKPVIFINWFDAARYANWKANAQNSSSAAENNPDITENGIYELDGDTLIATTATSTAALAEDDGSFDRELKSSEANFHSKNNVATASSGYTTYDYCGAAILGAIALFGLSQSYDCLKSNDENIEVLKGRLSDSSRAKFNVALEPGFQGPGNEGCVNFDESHLASKPTISEPLSLAGFKKIGAQSENGDLAQHDPLQKSSSWLSGPRIESASFSGFHAPENYDLPDEFIKALGAQSSYFTDQEEARKTGLTPAMMKKTFDHIDAAARNRANSATWLEEIKNKIRNTTAPLNTSFNDQIAGMKESIPHMLRSEEADAGLNNEMVLSQKEFDAFVKDYHPGLEPRLNEAIEKADPALSESIRACVDLITSAELNARIDVKVNNVFLFNKELRPDLVAAYERLASYRFDALKKKEDRSLAIASQIKAISYLEEAIKKENEEPDAYRTQECSQKRRSIVCVIQSLHDAAKNELKHAQSLLPKENHDVSRLEALRNWLSGCFKNSLRNSNEENIVDGTSSKEIAELYSKAIAFADQANFKDGNGYETYSIYKKLAENQHEVADAIKENKGRPHPGSLLFINQNSLISYQLKAAEASKAAAIEPDKNKKELQQEEAEAWNKTASEAGVALNTSIELWEEKNAIPALRAPSFLESIGTSRGRLRTYSSANRHLQNLKHLQQKQQDLEYLLQEQKILVGYCQQAAELLEKKDKISSRIVSAACTEQENLIGYVKLATQEDISSKTRSLNQKASVAYQAVIPETIKLGELNAVVNELKLNNLSSASSTSLERAALSRRVGEQIKLIAHLKNIVHDIQGGAGEEKIQRLEMASLMHRNAIVEAEEAILFARESDKNLKDAKTFSEKQRDAVAQVQRYANDLITHFTTIAAAYADLNTTPQQIEALEKLTPAYQNRTAAAERLADYTRAAETSKTAEEWKELLVLEHQNLVIARYNKLIEASADEVASIQKENEVIIPKYEKLVSALVKHIELNDKLSAMGALLSPGSNLTDLYVAGEEVQRLQKLVVNAAYEALANPEDLAKAMPEQDFKIKLYKHLVTRAEYILELKKASARATEKNSSIQSLIAALCDARANQEEHLLAAQEKSNEAAIEKGTFILPKASAEERFHYSLSAAYGKLLITAKLLAGKQAEDPNSVKSPSFIDALKAQADFRKYYIETQKAILDEVAQVNFNSFCYKLLPRVSITKSEKKGTTIKWNHYEDDDRLISSQRLVSSANDMVSDQKMLATANGQNEKELRKSIIEIRKELLKIAANKDKEKYGKQDDGTSAPNFWTAALTRLFQEKSPEKNQRDALQASLFVYKGLIEDAKKADALEEKIKSINSQEINPLVLTGLKRALEAQEELIVFQAGVGNVEWINEGGFSDDNESLHDIVALLISKKSPSSKNYNLIIPALKSIVTLSEEAASAYEKEGEVSHVGEAALKAAEMHHSFLASLANGKENIGYWKRAVTTSEGTLIVAENYSSKLDDFTAAQEKVNEHIAEFQTELNDLRNKFSQQLETYRANNQNSLASRYKQEMKRQELELQKKSLRGLLPKDQALTKAQEAKASLENLLKNYVNKANDLSSNRNSSLLGCPWPFSVIHDPVPLAGR